MPSNNTVEWAGFGRAWPVFGPSGNVFFRHKITCFSTKIVSSRWWGGTGYIDPTQRLKNSYFSNQVILNLLNIEDQKYLILIYQKI